MQLVHIDGLKIWPQIHAFLIPKSSISPIFVTQDVDDEGGWACIRAWVSISLKGYGNRRIYWCLQSIFTDCCIQGKSILVFIRITHHARKAHVCMGIWQQTVCLPPRSRTDRCWNPEGVRNYLAPNRPKSLYNLFWVCWIQISRWFFDKMNSFCVRDPQRRR